MQYFRPTPVYTWSRIDVYGQKHVVESGKDDMLYDGNDPRILVIKPAKRHHAGRYFCTATIGNKNDTVEGSLSFQGKLDVGRLPAQLWLFIALCT
jgi:predicted transcriptional regulator